MAASKKSTSRTGSTRRTATRKPTRRAAAQLPGEKAVRGTGKTVPLTPRKASRVEKEPLDPREVDRRKHFDDEGNRPRNACGVGSSSRSKPPIPLSE
jgi:hypothetical protein